MSLERAELSLEGLSVGDAFGERFFGQRAEERIARRELADPPWHWTDDTAMAQAIMEVLRTHGEIDRDALARAFADGYRRDIMRGYGGTAHEILQTIARGGDWRQAAGGAFDGQGSMGNGAAMRVGPVGAYFAEDLERVVAEARRSAEPTHAHPDGQAGAIAVAVAAALVWRKARGHELLREVLARTPPGETHHGLAQVAGLRFELSPREVAGQVGNGSRVISSDTVPLALWCAARHLDDYEEAMWATVSALGDRDTTCAIAGSLVALASPVPDAWLVRREPLAWPIPSGRQLDR